MTVKLPEAYISFPLQHSPVSRLTHTATCESAEFDTTSLLRHRHTHTHTVAHMHAKDCTPTPTQHPKPSQKMNEVDISLKVKLKMAIITLLPIHYPNNAMWLFVLDWASLGVWPHNLILLAQTSLQPSATSALYSGQNRAQPFPTEI